MFNIETYITPILLSYLDKYVQNFKAGDAQVSLWGGGVTLHNLVLKPGVLQQEVALPFTLISGRIHELLIQVPWTKIMSESIVVTINTIECILSLDPPTPDETAVPERRRSQVVEAPPGYMQALVRRIVSNISVRINSLIVKYVHDDIVLSLTVKRLAVDSVGADWQPLFADIDPVEPLIRRLVRLDDLTLCLDKCDSDGKIRFYQEPVLYRCQLDLRVLTRLVSAKTRRASSFSVQLRTSLMSWGVTSEQLELLFRLLRDNPLAKKKPPSPLPKPSYVQPPPLQSISSNSAEPVRSESWSQWAWSWMPTWMDREGLEESPAPATPIPIALTLYLEQVALVFKVLEEEFGRQRPRNILSLSAKDAVLKGSMCSPVMVRVKFGARDLSLSSCGRCVCGHDNINTINNELTVYLSKTVTEENDWKWADEDFNDQKIELGVAADEQMRESPIHSESINAHTQPSQEQNMSVEADEEKDTFWTKMTPVVYVELNHDRAPSDSLVNPYDNPPRDFEYSDWVEECVIKVITQSMSLQVSTDLLHRLRVIKNIFDEVSLFQDQDPPMRTLTVEECEALSDNLPQRRIGIEINGLSVRLIPWDHSLTEKPVEAPIVLDVDIPKAALNIAAPLYPHRVCSAACQMPYKSEPLWQGARLHISGNMSLQARVCSSTNRQPGPCLCAQLNFVTHSLLHKEYFTSRKVPDFSYTVKIKEANVCGSSARLQAAYSVPVSLFTEKPCVLLKYTTLASDALNDEEAVAIDVTLEELMVWGFRTKMIHTHVMTLRSVKATAHHAEVDDLIQAFSGGVEAKQVWLFSGPDSPTTTQYIRIRFQLCKEPMEDSVDYLGIWLEPTALCIDPLLGAWLAYRPKINITESRSAVSLVKITPSSQYLSRCRQTPPSSSGRGGSRSGSGTEQVHSRTRSVHSTQSGSERSEKKDIKSTVQTPKAPESRWSEETLLKMHERLKRLLIAVETGVVLIYVPSSSANAAGCVTVRDAIERHAMASQKVLVVSLGRWSIISPTTKHLWEEVQLDGPTFLTPKNEKIEDAFPWRMRVADVSCYTLEVRAGTELSGREKAAKGLKSQLKSSHVVIPRAVLELVTTSITLSVVTKSMKIRVMPKKPEQTKRLESCSQDDVTKYFTSGIDFKPSTLKEFVRGPSRRKNTSSPEAKETETEGKSEELYVKNGPIVSLGVNIHADTPPVSIRLDHDQICVIGEAVHSCIHVLRLLQMPPLTIPKQNLTSSGSSHRSLIRCASELETQSVSLEAESVHRSEELIPIFEANPEKEPEKLKTFLWFQWVVSHAKLLVTTPTVKLVFDADDVISSLDMQERYDQLKIKVASASVRHFERTSSEEWVAGVLGGRVLEAREPTNATEESDFLAVTVTSVLISTLPPSLNEELTLKSFNKSKADDCVLEIYVALAPLEVVLRPNVLEPIVSVAREFLPKSSCPLRHQDNRSKEEQRPLVYVSAGGVRLLLADQIDSNVDDTIMFVMGKTTVNPYPQNPICRNTVNPAPENTWISGLVLEGRQYEVLIKSLAVRSVRFQQLADHEVMQSELSKTGGENPALKWSQQVDSPIITPILHSMDVSLVLAPPVFVMGALICGPGVEINFVSDCSLELSLNRLNMMITTLKRFRDTLDHREEISTMQLENTVCPYAVLDLDQTSPELSPADSDTIIIEDAKSIPEIPQMVRTDSGIITSQSAQDTSVSKKSVAFVDYTAKSSHYLELWIAMWLIELSIYVTDDGSPEVVALRPPTSYHPPTKEHQKSNNEPMVKVIVEEYKGSKREDPPSSMGASRSLTDTVRHADIAKQNIDLAYILPLARKTEGNLPLLHLTLSLPNLYYFRQKNHKRIQASLFNLSVGLGAGETDGQWHSPLITTGNGILDPETGIEPALLTLQGVLAPSGTKSSETDRNPVKLDVERPLQLELSTDKLKRLKGIMKLVEKNVPRNEDTIEGTLQRVPTKPRLYRFRRFMVHNNIDTMSLKTSDIEVKGELGSMSWKMSLQLGVGRKPDSLFCKLLLCVQNVTVGPSTEARHLLQPMMAGAYYDATWETWRRGEGTLSAREPSIRLGLDLDRAVLDVRPEDLDALVQLNNSIRDLMDEPEPERVESKETVTPVASTRIIFQSGNSTTTRLSTVPLKSTETVDNFYKDDFRSGAFKLVKEGPVPMAYQILILEDRVIWRYPHPRTIIKLIISPIPEQETETECVLELYCPLLCRWERHSVFTIPINEEIEYPLSVKPSEAVFASLWRVKICSHLSVNPTNYTFDMTRFMSGRDPLAYNPPVEEDSSSNLPITGQHLFGALRMDSTFAPRLLPRLNLAVKLSCVELNIHNTVPTINREATNLEGYYVSRPLCRSHRVMNLRLTDTAAHLLVTSTPKIVFDAELSSDIIDSATGTLEPLISEFRTQGVVYLEKVPRTHVRAGNVRVAIDVPRVYTARALAHDWMRAYYQNVNISKLAKLRRQAKTPIEELDGRVALWVHNQCSVALRIGQEGTEEVVPVGAGVSLAYRWRSPSAPKKLRFAFSGPYTDWHWSNSIAFREGSCKVWIEELAEGTSETPPLCNELYVRVEGTGARRDMFLSGRVRLVNVLRQPLVYKVRYRRTTPNPWQTITAGVLNPESIGPSVLCGSGSAVLKVKFTSEEAGWSGDIPVQECRRENFPWLVKIPKQGEVPFTAVWCRVVRSRSDGRFVATFWPFYVFTSQLPLDIDMMITSEFRADLREPKVQYVNSQTATGRGACTHISAPGTSGDRHNLVIQYRDLECPVSKNKVELRYELAETPVFEESAPIQTVDELYDIINQWLDKRSRDAKSTWPYAIVRNHWPGKWKPALLQPKSDINIRYIPVRAGGGCALEVRLSPRVLFANASTLAITLRSYDGAPLCKVEPGVAISPPLIIVTKPFYMSVEMGRETFVSTKLQVCNKEPGRYSEPSPQQVWLDLPTRCAIHCNQKVALLSLTYELEESINVFGLTSTYAIRNCLKMNLLVSAIAVPKETEQMCVLRPKAYKVIHPTGEESFECTPLTRFSIQGRWRGEHADELNTFLCFALDDATPAHAHAPVRLALPPLRRPMALRQGNQVIPVVVCQQQHAGRWVITVAEDPCPQFLIYNRTAKPLAVAEPEKSNGEIKFFVEPVAVSDFNMQQVGTHECSGAKWWCVVEANSSTYYSCPDYYTTYPPTACTKRLSLPLLVGILREDTDPDWSEPFTLLNGEKLLQLSNGVTIKLNIKINPHTTLIELLDVDQCDLSASEIRRQLIRLENPVQSNVNNQIPIANNDDFMNRDEGTNAESHHERITLSQANSSIQPKIYKKQMVSKSTDKSKVLAAASEIVADSSLADLSQAVRDDINASLKTRVAEKAVAYDEHTPYTSTSWQGNTNKTVWSKRSNEVDRIRALVDGLTITFAKASDDLPILAITLQRLSLWARENARKQRATLAIANVQIDNTQYESGEYDFAVVATTDASVEEDVWPPFWNMTENMFDMMEETAGLVLITRNDRWKVGGNSFNEMTKVEARVGPLGLYIEDAYVAALVELARVAMPPPEISSDSEALTEAATLCRPLRIRRLYIHPLHLTLTLHTAVRMYIALDQSPLLLSEFELLYVMTSQENLIRALTVHYLSAAILGAGWVVGGLELLGSPAAAAARVAEASGGARGVATAAGAALLRSLSACASSVARNLDLLAGDDEHTRRAAAARRRQPPSLMAGLVDGVSNFAITLLGAVGGLAHHPLLAVVVGETDSRVVGLRRGLLGAIAKPLSATADLVASAGHGLLNQTGWDPVPQPLWSKSELKESSAVGWRRDCVRWTFRLPELSVRDGFEAQLGDLHLLLLLTEKHLVIFDMETDRVIESINFKSCSIGPWTGGECINVRVSLKKTSKMSQPRLASDDDFVSEINPTTLARVARYTGAPEDGEHSEPSRELTLTPRPGLAHALHAALAVAVRHNAS